MTNFIADAFIAACRDELEAPKPGNVHVYAAGHGMTAAQFEASAAAAAGPLCAPSARVGARIRGAIEATVAAVGTNTNLGIVLLCAPLAAAADSVLASTAHPLPRLRGWDREGARPHIPSLPPGPLPIPPPQAGEGEDGDLRHPLRSVLDGLDVADAADAFAAIVQASPGGLGRAERHDVFAPPRVTLKQAMAEAADRDRVARQYATGFADVLDVGMPLRAAAAARWSDPKFVTLAVYLGFLSRFPDSHILRKHGEGTAAGICRAAQKFDALLGEAEDPAAIAGELLGWDAELKARGLNPGTTADLTVATLFAARLQSCLAVCAH
jgi:triphosphoribosyl-dephospho-CoA synthase